MFPINLILKHVITKKTISKYFSALKLIILQENIAHRTH